MGGYSVLVNYQSFLSNLFSLAPPKLFFSINCIRNRLLRVSFIELFYFIIYQHLNKRTNILPLATSQIAHLCHQFNYVLHCQFLSHVLKALFFNQNSPKIKLFLLKNAKFSSARGSNPRSPCLRRLEALPPNSQPPAARGFAPRPPLAIFPKTAPPNCRFLATRLLYVICICCC